MLTQADLAQFSGTEKYYQHWLRRFVYTDAAAIPPSNGGMPWTQRGVHYVAETGGAYWLVDAMPKAER